MNDQVQNPLPMHNDLNLQRSMGESETQGSMRENTSTDVREKAGKNIESHVLYTAACAAIASEAAVSNEALSPACAQWKCVVSSRRTGDIQELSPPES